MTDAHRALGIDVEKLRRGVAYLRRGLALRLVPLAAAERVQWRLLRRSPAVAADEVEARHRDVELRAFRVFEREELGLAFAQVHALQAEVAADAVLLVNDR